MSALLNVPVVVAYHLVSALAAGLAVPLGGLAAAAAIVVFTIAVRLLVMPLSYYAMRGQNAQARLAPRISELRKRYARQPDRMQHEITKLYRAEGIGMFSGCLPVLVQAPFLSVMYLLFRSPDIGHAANRLLGHHLFSAALGSHWLSGAGPLSGQGAVFLGVFGLLALVGWLNSRLARRFPAPAVSPLPAAGPAAVAAGDAGTRSGGIFGALTRLAPFLTVVVAAFVPLAAGLYLATSAAWALAERAVLRRRL